MNRCDAVIVSTQALRRQVEAVLSAPKPIYIRRNMVGEPLRVARLDAYEKHKRLSVDPEAPVEIFYGSGTKAHKAYFDETVMPALIDVARDRPNARITLLGEFDLADLPADVAGQFACETRMLLYPYYLARLAKADISIAPLNLNPVTDAKSELKWFEAACVGTACVVSPTATYLEAIEGGRHALFANNRQEWREALRRLIDEPLLRHSLVKESGELIERNYEIRRAAAALIEDMGLANAAPAKPPRKRLLVINTYFRPQSIGGATRIAEAYAQDLARRYGDRFEVFALCADAKHRSNPPYLVTALRQDEVTVLRCAVPVRDWADPVDSKVEEVVERIASGLAIDVVHAHSVQILTASAVEALAKKGIPVLVSLHDAWWLSEHQFLVDDDGKAFQPHPDLSDLHETTCRRMSQGERMRRRSYLTRVLRQCARRLAVSESFAEIYRQAGVPKVETLENGMTLPAKRPPRPAAAQGVPLRIGFIGGLSAHKGLRLLENVVRSEQFVNLEFVLVDHRFEHGYERESQWGGSRIVFIGKAPQSRVAEVYARFDILAAPSIWPESFGLVTREARAYGVAVIASDRGDIGRGIGPGDGWVIDVSNDRDLRQLLRRLNADPASGRLTPSTPKAQSVEAAVNKLVGMLEQALA
jgi:glycosyltransferase involved in cell wall biosynthesis